MIASVAQAECPKKSGCEVIMDCKGEACKEYNRETHVVVRKASKCDLELADLKKKMKAMEDELASQKKLNDSMEDHINKLEVMLGQKPQVVTQVETRTVIRKLKIEAPKNIVSGMVGQGFIDARLRQSGSAINLDAERGAVFGLQYQRRVTEKLYLGGFGMSNETYGLSLGLGF